MATHFTLGSRALHSQPRLPCTRESRDGLEKQRGKGWGPRRVTTHLRPPPCSPRAAAAARSSPWPGGAGSSRAGRVREGAETSGLRDEAPPSSGRTGGPGFFLLLGRRAWSAGAGSGKPGAGTARGGGVTLAHQRGGSRAPGGRWEPRDHSRPGRAAPRSCPAGSSAASPGLGARSRR